jgi:prophage maintenance system killer protein
MTLFIPSLSDQENNNYQTQTPESVPITEINAVVALANLKAQLIAKSEADEGFGQLADGKTFEDVLEYIYKDNNNNIPIVQDIAPHILSQIIYQRPYIDGNKRCASFLFVRYLDKNKCLYDSDGNEKISSHMLQALVLLITHASKEEEPLLRKLMSELLK